LLGTEGLALLRLAFTGDDVTRRARVHEMRSLLERMDEPELAATLAAPEYDLADGYALWAKTYDAPLRLFFIEQPAMHAVFATLQAGGTVLDAACGTGRHSVELAQRGHQIIGVDYSPDMLELARKKLPRSDFRQGDLSALPVGTGTVDTVICALALVHLPELGGAMAEFARVLRPGGRQSRRLGRTSRRGRVGS
jgi:ubiquinone/menaquinone biosynthesis C-methylase UbiE